MSDLIVRAANDLKNSRHAVVLTGAGMSTESGLRDFRGPKGLWTTNKEAEAKAYERYDLFLRDPRAYWEEMLGKKDAHGAFYYELRKAEPNPGHYALADLEEAGVVKCVITQNIDGLHPKAGSRNVLEFHGSVNKLRCSSCGSRSAFKEDALEILPPLCYCGGVLKLDVVHFKEPIPLDVMEKAEAEVARCDAMLICGTSAVVYPFAGLPRAARMGRGSSTVIIEINAEPTPLTSDGISDYLIQGKLGEILPGVAAAVLGSS